VHEGGTQGELVSVDVADEVGSLVVGSLVVGSLVGALDVDGGGADVVLLVEGGGGGGGGVYGAWPTSGGSPVT
jgi:hypothetical protein